MQNLKRAVLEKNAYFFNPWVDFMSLGGGSIIVLLAIAIWMPRDADIYVAAFTLWLAHFINHPHFAHSYQIFYGCFFKKILSKELPLGLRVGYWFAGIVVPVLLSLFFGFTFLFGNYVVLGLAVNLMAFLVGWHYVKQGYGILMADSVLKKTFFSAREKNVFLVNAYICWFATWVYANQVVSEKQFFSLHYYTFEAPPFLVYFLVSTLCVSSVLIAALLLNRLISGKGFPFNGVVAYLVSLYLWIVCAGINPLFILIIPAFHSLQYLVVVWRYKINSARSQVVDRAKLCSLPFGRFFNSYVHYKVSIFTTSAVLLGYFGFWGVPFLLDDVIAYDRILWGTSVVIVTCWVFINVHHYFIDSVMWRKNNKDIQQHLFSHV